MQLHSTLLQRSLKAGRAAQYRTSMAAVPVAVREAAFVEAADCFVALLGRAEVGRRRRAGVCSPLVLEGTADKEAAASVHAAGLPAGF